LARDLGRNSIKAAHTTPVGFSGIQGYIYAPEGEGKRPGVICLAPFSKPRVDLSLRYIANRLTDPMQEEAISRLNAHSRAITNRLHFTAG
jgi:hypothetical protein